MEVHPTALALVLAKSDALILEVAASMIIWAGFNDYHRCIAFVDTTEMPAVVHAVKAKSGASSLFRYLMHKVSGQDKIILS